VTNIPSAARGHLRAWYFDYSQCSGETILRGQMAIRVIWAKRYTLPLLFRFQPKVEMIQYHKATSYSYKELGKTMLKERFIMKVPPNLSPPAKILGWQGQDKAQPTTTKV